MNAKIYDDALIHVHCASIRHRTGYAPKAMFSCGETTTHNRKILSD